MSENAEQVRLRQAREKSGAWKKWGPYLSERQWGTVREDYSTSGDAWNYFTHDQARSRAYRWGEDGIAGFSDDFSRLCFGLALWNGSDPILKERMFGLTNSEGNHGEDVKEYYFYLDSTPTHSYMKYLSKYPQRAYPYEDLIRTNRERTREQLEYELLDTGIFDDDRYFDVFVEYAKASPEDVLIKITIHNRGPEAASLRLLPTLWFRNTWSWTPNAPRPEMKQIDGLKNASVIAATEDELGQYYLYCEGVVPILFTENETNHERLDNSPNRSPYVKDGINNAVVNGRTDSVNPEKTGTKSAADYALQIPAGQAATVRLRLTTTAPADAAKVFPQGEPFGAAFDESVQTRLQEANAFYQNITPPQFSDDEKNVMRQALAGMLWSKQFYYFDLDLWLKQHDAHPLISTKPRDTRNRSWFHMNNANIISMPDKWEYPWYAAWDLAFHTVALSAVDQDFAKQQLHLMLTAPYLHPNGQIPAYEWNFSDVNPPVHAWATLFNYRLEQQLHGQGDLAFLEESFQALQANYSWWVNRKDPEGKNVFEGGFLGLDNIGVFDRSAQLPTGGRLEQADGTAWMMLFSQNMFEMALELAMHDSTYEEWALKYLQQFLLIAASMDRVGENADEMWDEQDGFFYDVLRLPDGTAMRLKVRSMVGLLPLTATTILPLAAVERFPSLVERATEFVMRNPHLVANIARPGVAGAHDRRLLSALNKDKMRRVLERMLDEERFLSPYGIRSLSRWHLEHPFVFNVHGEEFRVQYLPAESNTGMFGGNSNWRGPIWMPVNALIIRALLHFYSYYGTDFKIECPTGSGNMMTLFEVAQELSKRLSGIFLRDANGRRPVYGGTEKFQTDPHWRDYILFYEYFHGDMGAGLGASHQTGWTGLVARLMQLFGVATPDGFLASQRFVKPAEQAETKG